MENKPIGGFIEWEFMNGDGSYHPKALAMANSRAGFNLFIKEVKPSKIYLPYYTCDALLQPLVLNKITFEFYSIDKNLEPVFDKKLQNSSEYFLYINYFAIKDKKVDELHKKYGAKLIVDNSMSFFSKKYKLATSFNSCRKFFGVPDGGYLYFQKPLKNTFERNTNYLWNHLISRAIGDQEIAYKQFLDNEKTLGSEIKRISMLSERILNQVDYEYVMKTRTENFRYLHNKLSVFNQIKIDLKSINIPLYYPFLPPTFIDKNSFIDKKLFIPTLWPDVLKRQIEGFELEKYLTRHLLPLPIDQRYNKKDMNAVLKLLKMHL